MQSVGSIVGAVLNTEYAYKTTKVVDVLTAMLTIIQCVFPNKNLTMIRSHMQADLPELDTVNSLVITSVSHAGMADYALKHMTTYAYFSSQVQLSINYISLAGCSRYQGPLIVVYQYALLV